MLSTVNHFVSRSWQRLRARLSRPRWIVRLPALPNERLCILVTYAAQAKVADRVLLLAQAWRSAGYAVLLVVATDHPRTLVLDAGWATACDGLMVRGNHGYDFGSWAAAVRALRRHWSPSLLALANDSVYGPCNGFAELLRRVESSKADVIGLTDSYDYRHHLQSYLTFYKPTALKNPAFIDFWSTYWAGGRGDIIWHAELELLRRMKRGQLQVEVLFPSPINSPVNPTLQCWRELIASGFPFVKKQLLKDNPTAVDITGWKRVLEEADYDPENIVRDLGVRFAFTAAGLHS